MTAVGVIDVGGGFRGIYAAAVLDRCLDEGIDFDLAIGVSAGSANLASFIAQQKRRNYMFYTEFGLRKQYAGIGNFVRNGSYVNLDYVYGTLSNSIGEYPLDFKTFSSNPTDFEIVATNAQTGAPYYFKKSDMQLDEYSPLKASSALPAVGKPYYIHGAYYYDGALSDPVPIRRALNLGCDKVVVLLTKPKDTLRTPSTDVKLAKLIQRKYPNSAYALRERSKRYNTGVLLSKKLEEQGKALIVAPEHTCGVSTLTRDKEKLNELYEMGYSDGEDIGDFIK